MATSWISFGNDPPYATLPDKFKYCLPPSNIPTAYCDAIVGTASTGGYCALDEYKQSTYCSCVNYSDVCPLNTTACSNNIHSYKPMSLQPGQPYYEMCKGKPLCINSINVTGTNNVVSDSTQVCGGGSKDEKTTSTPLVTSSDITPVQSSINWKLVVLLFIILISVIALCFVVATKNGTGSKISTT